MYLAYNRCLKNKWNEEGNKKGTQYSIKVTSVFQPCKHSQETYPICNNIIWSKELLNFTDSSFPTLILFYQPKWLDKEEEELYTQ